MNNPSKEQSYIILFDGVCNFCNYWVNFILKRDKNNRFKFSALQSESGKKLLNKFNLPENDFDSFILIAGDKIFKKSTAAFIVASQLSGISKIILPFKIFPNSLTDFIYDLIAKNRYKIFGKKNKCRIPTEQEKGKFI
jgi:predicted DCC family thiol-disulfide oxidoreductase YuxK